MAREVINCCNVISHFLMTDINNTQNDAKLSFKPGVYKDKNIKNFCLGREGKIIFLKLGKMFGRPIYSRIKG